MKKYLIFAASALALASCSSDDFLGENPGNVQNATTAINFGGDAGKITRATSNEGDDHVKLDNQFKVYGVKKTNEKFVTVFKDYSVWYDENLTTSNTNKWEYVGKNNQTIKYWDYSATEYRFVAGSPIAAFSFKVPSDGTTKNIESATITGLGGHIKQILQKQQIPLILFMLQNLRLLQRLITKTPFSSTLFVSSQWFV